MNKYLLMKTEIIQRYRESCIPIMKDMDESEQGFPRF